MRFLQIICVAIGMSSCLMGEPLKQSEASPRDELVKWINGHQIPEVIDVKNVNSMVPNRYIHGDPARRRNSTEFMEWMGIQKDQVRVDFGANLGLFRSFDLSDDYILILFMHYGGSADESYVLKGIVIRQVDDNKLSKILGGLWSSGIKQWKEAAPKEGEQGAVE